MTLAETLSSGDAEAVPVDAAAPEPADCAASPGAPDPARAIDARIRDAISAPRIVFLLGARITGSSFRLLGRIRFVLSPSILLWPSRGNRCPPPADQLRRR